MVRRLASRGIYILSRRNAPRSILQHSIDSFQSNKLIGQTCFAAVAGNTKHSECSAVRATTVDQCSPHDRMICCFAPRPNTFWCLHLSARSPASPLTQQHSSLIFTFGAFFGCTKVKGQSSGLQQQATPPGHRSARSPGILWFASWFWCAACVAPDGNREKRIRLFRRLCQQVVKALLCHIKLHIIIRDYSS